MQLGKTIRGIPGSLVLIVVGTLALGVAQGTHDGQQEVENWRQKQTTYTQQSPRKLSLSNAPQPPPPFALVETSGDGSAMGFQIEALAQRLSRTLAEGSNSEETLENLHEAICFAVFSLLENRTDLGDPMEMARRINVYLVGSDHPRIHYAKVRKDLEKIYVTLRRASSTDELSREVTEAILC